MRFKGGKGISKNAGSKIHFWQGKGYNFTWSWTEEGEAEYKIIVCTAPTVYKGLCIYCSVCLRFSFPPVTRPDPCSSFRLHLNCHFFKEVFFYSPETRLCLPIACHQGTVFSSLIALLTVCNCAFINECDHLNIYFIYQMVSSVRKEVKPPLAHFIISSR